MPKANSFPTAPHAALFAALLLCGSVRASEPDRTREGRAHFDAGVRYLDQRKYAEAYRELKEAYATTPRGVVLGNLGLAAEQLERDGEAIDALKQYLDRGGSKIDARVAAQHRSTIERLEKGSAKVTLEAPGTFWIIDTRTDGATGPVVNEYGPFEDEAVLRVRAGEHELQIDRSTIAATAWSVRLYPKNDAHHVFEPDTPPSISEEFVAEPSPAPLPVEAERDTASSSHTASYVLWGTGAAAVLATTAILLEARSIQSDANERFARICPFGATPSGDCSDMGEYEKAADWRTAGLVTGIGAAGVIATGTVLYFLGWERSSDRGPVQQATLQPWISPGGIGISGAF